MKLLLSFLLCFILFSVAFFSVIEDESLQEEITKKHTRMDGGVDANKNVLLFLKGEDTLPKMSASEESHMQDVRRLFGIFKVVLLLGIIGFVVGIFKVRSYEILRKLWIPLCIILVVGGLALLIPDFLFNLFHKVFFPQGNYLFSPDSFLITLYPAGYFYEVFHHIVVRAVVFILFFIGLDWILRIQNNVSNKIKKKN